MLHLANDGDLLNGHLRGVACFDYKAGVWVDEPVADDAAEKGARHCSRPITEGVPDVELFTERVTLTPSTMELPIECIEPLRLSR